jgi:hypothetical protein
MKYYSISWSIPEIYGLLHYLMEYSRTLWKIQELYGIFKNFMEYSASSVPATTHSNTIQPTVSADGKLLSPLFLCLQETDDEFGPRISANLQQRANVYVTCSKSGKLTKSLLHDWCSNVFFPTAPTKALLFLDS